MECFLDFLDHAAAHSAKRYIATQFGLLVVKAFTKLHAMAGLRLGYALCGDQAFLERMRCNGPPWVVSAPAQAAGIAALREQDYVARVRALIRAERPHLAEGLAALGCEVIPVKPISCCSARRCPCWSRCANRAYCCVAAQISADLARNGTVRGTAARRKTSACWGQ